jgi:hypothetical protein
MKTPDIQKTCVICGRKININPYAYAPPITNHPLKDEGLWHFKLGGYVCTNCFGKVAWGKEDLDTLKHDWGWEPPEE